VSSGLFNGQFPGLAYLYAELEPGQAKEAAAALWAEAVRMARDGVSEQELERQRTRLEFNEARERMSMEGMAGKLGYYEALGHDWRLADQVLERMRRVTSADIRRVMTRAFKPQDVSLVLYRPKNSQASGLDAQAWQALLVKAGQSLPPAAAAPVAAPSPVATALAPALADAAPDTVTAGFSIYTLSNGARLLVKPSHHTPLVSAFAVFKAGVRFEPADKAGAFELMNILTLKGTQRYGAQALADRLDDLGAVITPFADHDTYGFAAQALSSRLPQALDLLAEMAARPTFPEDEFQKERERLLKDIKDRKDEPDEYIEELFDAAFFKGLPYGRPVEGSAATVRRLTPEDLRRLHQQYIQPSNLVLVLVGDVEPAQAQALAEASLGAKAWPGQPVRLPKVAVVQAAKQKRQVVERLPKKQSHIMLGWKGPRVSDADYFPWRLGSSVLGEGMNSRLFTEVREKRGLCYTTYAGFDRGLDPGAIRVYVGTRPESEAQALKVALDVVAKFRSQGVTAEELESAKAYACGVFRIARQDFSAEARIAAQYEVWGLGAGMIAQFPERIQAVTQEQILEAAHRYLDLAHPVIAIIRP
jgi:zinc protease